MFGILPTFPALHDFTCHHLSEFCLTTFFSMLCNWTSDVGIGHLKRATLYSHSASWPLLRHVYIGLAAIVDERFFFNHLTKSGTCLISCQCCVEPGARISLFIKLYIILLKHKIDRARKELEKLNILCSYLVLRPAKNSMI